MVDVDGEKRSFNGTVGCRELIQIHQISMCRFVEMLNM